MSAFDVHVTSVPSHHAQLVVARLILTSNHTLSMQAAMEQAGKPPALVFKNISRKEAGQYAAHLKSLGIEYMIVEARDAADLLDNIITHEDVDDYHMKEFAAIRAHNAENAADNPQPDGTRVPATPSSGGADKSGNGDTANQTRQPDPQQPPALSLYPTLPRVSGEGSAQASARRAHHSGGLRIGSLDGKEIEAAEKSAMRKNLIVTAVLAGAIVIAGAAMYLLPQDNKFVIKKSPGKALTDNRAGQTKPGGNAAGQANAAPDSASWANTPRGAVTGSQRQLADKYVDSAKTNGNEADKQIAFYKMAISFNRYNHAAWHGLLQAYNELQMQEEARETEAQMKKLFGNQAMSVNNIVNEAYGELEDAYVNADGAYSVVYRSRKQNRDAILRDIFNMTRAVRNICACQNISIRAVTPSGKEMVVHSAQEASVHSFSEFLKRADIAWEN